MVNQIIRCTYEDKAISMQVHKETEGNACIVSISFQEDSAALNGKV